MHAEASTVNQTHTERTNSDSVSRPQFTAVKAPKLQELTRSPIRLYKPLRHMTRKQHGEDVQSNISCDSLPALVSLFSVDQGEVRPRELCPTSPARGSSEVPCSDPPVCPALSPAESSLGHCHALNS